MKEKNHPSECEVGDFFLPEGKALPHAFHGESPVVKMLDPSQVSKPTFGSTRYEKWAVIPWVFERRSYNLESGASKFAWVRTA